MHDSEYFFTCSELGLIVFEIDPKGCAARDGRVQVRDKNVYSQWKVILLCKHSIHAFHFYIKLN